MEYDEKSMNEKVLLQKVQFIEQSIFDKSFSFFQSESFKSSEVPPQSQCEANDGAQQKNVKQKNEIKKDSDDDIFDSQNESMNEEKPKIKQIQFHREESRQESHY